MHTYVRGSSNLKLRNEFVELSGVVGLVCWLAGFCPDCEWYCITKLNDET